MRWFDSLSIKVKILLIPVVASIGFCIYLTTTLLNNAQNETLLNHAYKTKYELLTASEFGLVRLDKIQETLANAVTMGESELIDSVKVSARQVNDRLDAQVSLNKSSGEFITQWLNEFERYVIDAVGLTEQMVDGTADFDKIADQASKINQQYQKLESDL